MTDKPIPSYAVDLKRYNDCDEGLVGVFPTQKAARDFINTIPDNSEREWAAIRPIDSSPLAETRPWRDGDKA